MNLSDPTKASLTLEPIDMRKIVVMMERVSVILANTPTIGEQPPFDKQQAIMDVALCHKFRCPLQLDSMLNADGTELVVDVLALTRNWDRSTFNLLNGYIPRFACRRII